MLVPLLHSVAWREKSGAEQGCSPVGATDLGGRNNTKMPISDLGLWPSVA